MSLREDRIMSLTGVDFSTIKHEDLYKLFQQHLNNGIHGICYSAYSDGEKPGTELDAGRIEQKIRFLKPYTQWIRTFSCTEGNEMIPEIAKKAGLKVMAGAWLSDDEDKNELEIKNLIEIANAGNADMVAVGNEVLYREELSEEALLSYIKQVKEQIPNIPVGYVDAYYEFSNRPALAEICDVIFANCYPFWEGCHIDYSLLYMKDMYRKAQNAAKGKKVIISETGWPNKGTAFEASEPSDENAMRYFINAQEWSKEENIEMMYFSSFDELWKVDAEGDVGAYWGLWDKNGQVKYHK